MALEKTTPIPNQVLDIHLPNLKPGELKVLLIILRQTYGWHNINQPTKRKIRDWIASSQFVQKTGLSRKSISQAIKSLITKKLIIATDQGGQELCGTEERKRSFRIYYQLVEIKEKSSTNLRTSFPQDGKKVRTTKETYTKENITSEIMEKFSQELSEAGSFENFLITKRAMTVRNGRRSVVVCKDFYRYLRSVGWHIHLKKTYPVPKEFWQKLFDIHQSKQ